MKLGIKNIQYILIVVFLSIIITIIGMEMSRNETKHFKRVRGDEYSGVVKEIKIFELNRGCPSYKIYDTWFGPGDIECTIYGFIKVGDSLFKETGTLFIKVYRKNRNGQYEQLNIKKYK